MRTNLQRSVGVSFAKRRMANSTPPESGNYFDRSWANPSPVTLSKDTNSSAAAPLMSFSAKSGTRSIRTSTYPLAPPPAHPDDKDKINSPFTSAELRFALLQLRRNTTPGLENVTYAILQNLPDNHQEHLLRIINQAWETGNIPSSWKEALVILLPKPGRPPTTPGNLRPISLTSLVLGRYMEKLAAGPSASWDRMANPPKPTQFVKALPKALSCPQRSSTWL
ncbi:reverse transcriptase, putative [Ixodes scapularis]|uniref:Reverse transcriptase, putative n=1 Tax=Ixodes scapularis TaxID=6945 RepID=B7Q1G8_IXOSC|nr:reverse transcriptase, putative [Ixodes scapularis]|eukprot:XP_002409607.1 reverse transcriptase, putative [Ixodes scapularis]